MYMPLVCAGAMGAWRSERERLGVDLSDDDPARGAAGDMVPLAAFVHLSERIAAHSGNLSLGWSVGERFDLGLLDPIGAAILSSCTLGAALTRLVGFFTLVQDATEFAIRREDAHCIVSYRILDPDIWPRHQDALFTLAIVAQLIRRVEGAARTDIDILIETSDATAAADLSRRASATCTAAGDNNALRFPAELLKRPLAAVQAVEQPDLGMLKRRLALKRRSLSIELRVRSLIYQHLGSAPIDQEGLSAQLGMSSRTLRRRLADEGVSFQQIVDSCRMRQAEHEFRWRGQHSIAQTALRLGYSEHSTFTRAFARWRGMPPQMFIRGAAAALP